MKKPTILIILLVLFFGITGWVFFFNRTNVGQKSSNEKEPEEVSELTLPAPDQESLSLKEALEQRRSIRDYQDEPITKRQLAQILWAAQGVTDTQEGFRTAPSAGALYPLELYIDVKEAEDLNPGVYKYLPADHSLEKVAAESKREKIYDAALRQSWIKEAPVLLVVGAVYERVTSKYDQRGVRYVHMEAGHAAQNVYLQATSLGLGTVSVGAFDGEKIKKVLEIEEDVLYLLPVGRPE